MRQLVLLCVLLLGVSWVAAQDSTTTSPKRGGAGAHTVEGCLSSSDGKYMLTDMQGKTFELIGDTSKLAEHVGHEVKITGTESSGTASAGGAGSQEMTLDVSSVKHISKTCKSGSMAH